MFGTNAGNAPKSLDETYWIPMQVVVDNLVTVLKIETFAQDICGDHYINFLHPILRFVLRICFWRKTPNQVGLVFIIPEDHFYTRISAWVQVIVEVSGGIRIRCENQAFSATKWPFKFLCCVEPGIEGLKLIILFWTNRFDKIIHFAQYGEVMRDVRT